ncbi:pSer/pThr/pTyr-binding forkhead associated (FHA) protein [Aeromicrobium panaciterrae]|uniref:PSer/pThr/pTyr-binding forkhead associated (FHA) protein n=1 Tax=Aeromicrobium panaciterrae TaxID=363861 RepID=A0ABU1UNX0_9ACTN|nr:pSer/pThr/pTyr-binding forkhead associated (FHA) protein [Aeromicrobium panaciterrae]
MPSPDHEPDVTAGVAGQSAGMSDHTTHIPILDADTEEMSSDDVTAVENLPAGSAMLLVQRGPDAGARFLLDSDTVSVGRHPDSDIFLDDISVSRRHATFTRSGAGYVIADLGSLNGSYVNRDRIDSEIPLAGGDEVQIGKYRLIYFAGASKAQS